MYHASLQAFPDPSQHQTRVHRCHPPLRSRLLSRHHPRAALRILAAPLARIFRPHLILHLLPLWCDRNHASDRARSTRITSTCHQDGRIHVCIVCIDTTSGDTRGGGVEYTVDQYTRYEARGIIQFVYVLVFVLMRPHLGAPVM